jgi:hypothetical protein
MRPTADLCLVFSLKCTELFKKLILCCETLGTAATTGLLYQPRMMWGWLWINWWNEDWQAKPKYSEKTCPSATLSTTNPTWLDPGLNPGRRGEKPATNRLSYGAALQRAYPREEIEHSIHLIRSWMRSSSCFKIEGKRTHATSKLQDL